LDESKPNSANIVTFTAVVGDKVTCFIESGDNEFDDSVVSIMPFLDDVFSSSPARA
jgi:hypothetical protein